MSNGRYRISDRLVYADTRHLLSDIRYPISARKCRIIFARVLNTGLGSTASDLTRYAMALDNSVLLSGGGLEALRTPSFPRRDKHYP